MADHPDRDRSIEHLLRQARAGVSSAPDGCLDAERLAAWSEGTLRPGESTLVETHLADCARCQAMLAAFAESAPVMPAAVPFWQRWTTRWLVPVAAASAAVLVWAVVTREPDQPATTMARVERFETPGGAPAPAPLPAPMADAGPDESREALASGAPSAQRPLALPEPPPPAPGAAAGAVESPQTRALVPSESQSAAADHALVSPGAPSEPEPRSTADAAARRDDGAAASQPASSAAPQPAPAAARRPAPSAAPRSAPATSVPPRLELPVDPVAVSNGAPAIQAQTGERSFSVGRAASGPEEIVGDFSTASSGPLADSARRDPNAPVDLGAPAPATSAIAVTAGTAAPPIRWRLMPDGRLARSADDGATWSPIALNPSVSIVAGSAPSALVCWLVDSAGVVWRSIDGATFQRTPASVDAALVSVHATDAVQATVVADDGRVFTTTDGGARWRELP